MINVTELHFALLFLLSRIQVSTQLFCRPTIEALPGGGSYVTRLNFKTFYVNGRECFMLLSRIEQKFFVFVGF